MESDKAFVLSKKRIKETDLILNLFSKKAGKISVFAPSALKSKNRFAGGVLDPSHLIDIEYSVSRKSDSLILLKSAKLRRSFSGIRKNYTHIQLAFYVLDLIQNLSQEEDIDSFEIYNFLGLTLEYLNKGESSIYFKPYFLGKLLKILGVLPLEDKWSFLLNKTYNDLDKNNEKIEELLPELTYIKNRYISGVNA